MKSKYLYYNFILVLLSVIFVRCNDFLEVNLKNQLTLEETFSKRTTTERYLAHVYSYLPNEFDGLAGEGAVTARSDEALWSWPYGSWNTYRLGTWGVANTDYHNWENRYVGINQATIFMENVDNCIELSEQQRRIMKAEARFLRAYFYFTLFRQYGPVYIWGDQNSDNYVKPDTLDRHTVDQNLDFIISEYDMAILDLPETITDQSWYGRVTKGAAMAAKSELTLYAARPLFNGCDLYKGKMKNIRGDYLFPQTSDPNKWEIAAKAAKDIIDLNQYSLYEYDGEATSPFQKAIKSCQGVILDKWNDELIWGKYISDAYHYRTRCLPKGATGGPWGNAGYGMSLKLIDAYPMLESGRYPVVGYQSNGEPIIDPKSGYDIKGFTDNWTHPLDDFATLRANNTYIGRDARFYANTLGHGMYWINRYKGIIQVTYHSTGTSAYSPLDDCCKTGFLWRGFLDATDNYAEAKFGNMVWPFYRLAEIYLNYAEACNEKPSRNEHDALLYVNLVRERSGLNKLEEAYPEVIGNKELLRELIRKERMVELAFECHRYYDVRTWMIAKEESNQPNFTLDLTSTTYDESWKRTNKVFPGKLVFEDKHYLFPIQQNQLSEMVNITQNYGW